MAYGHILKPDLLTVAPKGCFNLHAFFFVIPWCIPYRDCFSFCETETGIPHESVTRMDAGPIIDLERVKIPVSATGSDLRVILAKAVYLLSIDPCLY